MTTTTKKAYLAPKSQQYAFVTEQLLAEAAEKSPDVGRRYRCKYLRISLKISNFTSNSNTL